MLDLTSAGAEKGGPPPLPPTLAAAHREIVDLRRRNERQRALIRDYEERQRWTRQLLALPQEQLAPTTKAVAWAIDDRHRRHRERHTPGAPMPVYYGALGEQAGVSASSVCRAVGILEERGMLRRHSYRDPQTFKTHTEVEILPGLHDPAEMLPANRPRGQGGRRDDLPVCDACPANTPLVEQVERVARYTCTGCGTRLGELVSTKERLIGATDNDAGEGDAAGPATTTSPAATTTTPDGHTTGGPDKPLQICNGTPGTDRERDMTPGRGLPPAGPAISNETNEGGRPGRPRRHPQARLAPTQDGRTTGALDEPLQICNGTPTTGHDNDRPPTRGLPPTGLAISDGLLLVRLAEVAGTLPRHIAMQESGPHKYRWVQDASGRDRAPTPDELRAHLAGTRTLGSQLLHHGPDGRLHTYALGYDADDARGFARLQAAARRLWRAGARPVLERSPSPGHPGGGRLWVFFADPVDPGAAWATARAHAPTLHHCRECWPGPHPRADRRGQAVRLPAGTYRRDGVTAPIPHAPWRPDGPHWRTGRAAAALLLTELTPAGWVTADPPPPPPEAPARRAADGLTDTPVDAEDNHPTPAAWRDPAWLRRYGHHRDRLPFAVTAAEAIRWCNARHDVREILPKEANGYARATWRGERTPSIGYLPGNIWIDYGAGGLRPDGRRDGGDAFAALCRVRGLDRGTLLQTEIVPTLLGEAHGTLEACARAGEPLPGWLAAITTAHGWARYHQLHAAATN